MSKLWEHLIDRPAHYQPCPHCGRHTITAWCGGVRTRCDPEPLTINQEIAALLTGRQTYDVMIWGLPRRMNLAWRDITRIRAGRKYAIIATHKCAPGKTTPFGNQPETEITIRYASAAQHEQPQF